jgi:arsenical pump membrane protein
VAGLFVLVEGLQRTGVLRALSAMMAGYAHEATHATTSWCAGVGVAVAANVLSNLPVALIALHHGGHA